MDSTGAAKGPVSPWGQVQQPAETVCLADIMSEQLTKDLYIKEINHSFVELDEQPKSLPECLPQFCDSDLLIAHMLQTQFDEEYDMLKRTEHKFNGSSKVNISYSNYRVVPENLLYDSEDDEYNTKEKPREWDSFVSTEKAFKAMPKCGYKKQGTKMITKPDMTMSGRRSACRVMEFPPEFQTEDGGGFDMHLPKKVYNSLKVYSRNQQSRRNRHDKN